MSQFLDAFRPSRLMIVMSVHTPAYTREVR